SGGLLPTGAARDRPPERGAIVPTAPPPDNRRDRVGASLGPRPLVPRVGGRHAWPRAGTVPRPREEARHGRARWDLALPPSPGRRSRRVRAADRPARRLLRAATGGPRLHPPPTGPGRPSDRRRLRHDRALGEPGRARARVPGAEEADGRARLRRPEGCP